MALMDTIRNSALWKGLAKSKDMGLALTIISVIVMMLVPMPPQVLDLAIALSLAISLILVIAAIYIPNIVKVSAFPSILLLITIFRLGLHVAAARQILLKGYAGKIIYSFGKYAAGGNYIVGAVVYIIITVVQYIVVVKGSERISEVAARFALDAMPGKQMSIEADMRGGALNAKQARDARTEVAMESQLYGSMDGALKFVKGDAMAGIVVALVNIVGGILIGVIMHGLPAGEAAKKYLLLTIGEGLTSQISALLISISSGIIISKVSSKTAANGLADDILSQFFYLSTPIIVSGVFLMLMGFLPGMPWYIFVPLGAALSFMGYRTSKKSVITAPTSGQAMKDIESSGHTLIEGSKQEMSHIVPVILEAGGTLSNIIANTSGKSNINFMENMIPKMRLAIYNDLGLSVPGVHVNVFNNRIEEDSFSILLREVPTSTFKILKGMVAVNESEATLSKYKVKCKTLANPLGLPTLWTEEANTGILDNLAIKYWRVPEFVVLALSFFYMKFPEEFLGIQETKAIISYAEQDYPDLVKEVIRLLSLQKITDVFRRLVSEGISIKDIRSILEAIVENAQSEKSPAIVCEYIRVHMKRYITYRIAKGQSSANVYLLDPSLEDEIRSSIRETSEGSYLAMNPEQSQEIISSAKAIMSNKEQTSQVIVTSMDIRRFVHKLLVSDFPKLFVASYQELLPNVNIQPIGRIK